MMHLTERFQAFCQWCAKIHEADTAEQAIRAALEHEKCCPKEKKA